MILKISALFGMLPKVVYTYHNEHGDRLALVIKNDLDDIPNKYSIKPEMLNPQTPEAVRTMLFNELANRIRQRMYERLTIATRVILHTMPDGAHFLEVLLTDQGKTYLEDYNTNESHYYSWTSYERYDPSSMSAGRLWGRFTKPLKKVLSYLGMKPDA